MNHKAGRINEALGIEKERWDEIAEEVGVFLSENDGTVSKIIQDIENMKATELEKMAMCFMVGGFITDQINETKKVESMFKHLIKGVNQD